MIFLLALMLLVPAEGKIYERCELARELRDTLRAPWEQIATWVCIARHESNYNTNVVGPPNSDGSRDHGLFQINDRYWCYPPGQGCGQPCSKFEDNDITDDFACVQKIFKEHQGFTAWTVWAPHCSGGKADKYIEGCF